MAVLIAVLIGLWCLEKSNMFYHSVWQAKICYLSSFLFFFQNEFLWFKNFSLRIWTINVCKTMYIVLTKVNYYEYIAMLWRNLKIPILPILSADCNFQRQRDRASVERSVGISKERVGRIWVLLVSPAACFPCYGKRKLNGWWQNLLSPTFQFQCFCWRRTAIAGSWLSGSVRLYAPDKSRYHKGILWCEQLG